jgi:hypothetical protein
MRAIWDSWYLSKARLQGEFYTHTLMTPMFTPGDKPTVAARDRGRRQSQNDGDRRRGRRRFRRARLTSERYLREVTYPAISISLARGERAAR